jgi:hypothetical protein
LRGRQLASHDRAVELGRLFQGRHAELSLEHLDAIAKLAQSRGPAVGPRVEAHEHAVGGLVQGVERQPPAGVVDGLLAFAHRHESTRKPFQHHRQLPPPSLGLEELPIIEAGTVSQSEAGHEVAAMELRCGPQGCYARGADAVAFVPVIASSSLQFGEPSRVDEDLLAVEGHRGPPGG